jgi:hypothetical protein
VRDGDTRVGRVAGVSKRGAVLTAHRAQNISANEAAIAVFVDGDPGDAGLAGVAVGLPIDPTDDGFLIRARSFAACLRRRQFPPTGAQRGVVFLAIANETRHGGDTAKKGENGALVL